MVLVNIILIGLIIYILSYMFTFKNEFQPSDFLSVILFLLLVLVLSHIFNMTM